MSDDGKTRRKYRPNESYWRLARRMMHYRGTLILAFVFAAISAGGLSAGLLGMLPVLDNIFDDGDKSTLPKLAAGFNDKLGGWITIPQSWIDQLPDGRFDAVVAVVAALGVLTVIGATTNFLHQYLSFTVTTNTVASIRRDTFHHLIRMPLGALIRGKSSDLVSRVIQDSMVLNRGFAALTGKAVAQTTKGFGALVTAFIVDWKLSAVTIMVAPILATIIRKLGKRIRRASRGAMRSRGKLLGVATEVVRGFRVVKVHTAERTEIGRFTRLNNDVLREQLRERTARALASPLLEMVTIFVLGFLAIIAAKAIIDGSMEPDRFMVALASLAIAGGSFKPLSSIIQDIQKGDAAATRIVEILDADLEEHRDARKKRLPRHSESIEFRNVTFTYRGANEPALRSVSVRIEHGQTVAVVGPNGSGKTTLLGLAPRLYQPDAGAVLIDGHDIADVSLRSLRRQIGVVTQETVLFQGSIADNIGYAANASRDRIIAAAKQAHAHEFITAQPNGYDTEVGDQGLALSGGQRQRIAIARAILRDPAILIMDEATSMIDAESEAHIAQAIAEFTSDRTCLVVAHRLSTVVNADRILVMDNGQLIDDGTHDELLGRCAVYQLLARHQLAPSA